MAWLQSYDSNEVVIVINGLTVTGYTDGTFVKVAYNANQIEEVVGAEGEVTRVPSNDRSATVEITLMQTSSSNATLMVLGQQDRKDGSGIFSILVKGNNGEVLHSGNRAWIKKLPEYSYGKQAENRIWVISVAELLREQRYPFPLLEEIGALIGSAMKFLGF